MIIGTPMVIFAAVSDRKAIYSLVEKAPGRNTIMTFDINKKLSYRCCCKVVEVLQDFLSENVDKKFTTDYNVVLRCLQWLHVF